MVLNALARRAVSDMNVMLSFKKFIFVHRYYFGIVHIERFGSIVLFKKCP